MQTKGTLLNQLAKVEGLATASKIQRFLANPLKYVYAILHRMLFYPKEKKVKEVKTKVFFGELMSILLPASTDIYLTGGKTHTSEIKLANFIINNLSEGENFIDIGAHYGYFTLLASNIVGDKGKIVAFEAAHSTFQILEKNTTRKDNITAINQAVSDRKGIIEFYEFPNLYSEYNSIDKEQFEQMEWYSSSPPEKKQIRSIDLTSFLNRVPIAPKIIKIDVEGAEFKVIKGLEEYLLNTSNSLFISMEYLAMERKNIAHVKAMNLLQSLDFNCHVIKKCGTLVACGDVDTYLKESNLKSDNIIFSR